MSDVRCDVEFVGARLLVRVSGRLSSATAPRVRATLLKCLSEQPEAVVVDLSGVDVIEPAAEAVFLAASRHASIWPGTPLLISTPDRSLAGMLQRRYGRLAVHTSAAEALTASPRLRLPTISDVLLPVIGAASRARALVLSACEQWELPHLIGPGAVVAGELVSNSVDHAGTMITLRLSLGRRYLLIAVRDGAAAGPVLTVPPSPSPSAPRGLVLVDALAQSWGTHRTDDGKVVWAALRRG
ncbi:STAS domain-containing protein [Actinoplanes sp. CA-030573]|uniref:STAS domain-containing protein n=1 Tax=Actinoplanes sp. CA-030573 TaxID=3239898 RepID=UPI003D8ED208